jgi:uncharacterized protein YcfJ
MSQAPQNHQGRAGRVATALVAATLFAAGHASAAVTFYEREAFRGPSFSTDLPLANFDRQGFNDRASSAVVTDGPWEVCEEERFGGRCSLLRPGRYPSLVAMGLNDRISSVRPAQRPPEAPAAVTFYDQEGFGGRRFTSDQTIFKLTRESFNDRASSAVVTGGAWEVCSDPRFAGRCTVLQPGQYPSLAPMGLNDRISSVRRVDGPDGRPPVPPPPVPIAPSASFFDEEGLRGRMFTTAEPVGNLDRQGFNERAASAEVSAGTWQVCEDPRFGGRCTRLSPGRYPTLASMGLQDRVASVRAVEPDGRVIEVDERPRPAYDARRRGGERLYQADVTSVRAVVGPPEERCWVEREQVAGAGRPNVGGAIAGALIGGILGHQVGGGSGRDLATAGGVIAGAAVGANINRDRGEPGQNVQRCAQVDGRHQAPAYWDVDYNFRGVNHRVQMSTPPQRTVTVNEQGEPRV